MRDTIDFMFSIICLLAIAFVFEGDPDLWDVWHEKAMQTSQQCQ